jgi:hypothetical protein
MRSSFSSASEREIAQGGDRNVEKRSKLFQEVSDSVVIP